MISEGNTGILNNTVVREKKKKEGEIVSDVGVGSSFILFKNQRKQEKGRLVLLNQKENQGKGQW